MPARRYPQQTITAQGRERAMINRIHFCTPEMFETLTAAGLADEHDVPLAVAEQKLAAAKVGRVT